MCNGCTRKKRSAKIKKNAQNVDANGHRNV